MVSLFFPTPHPPLPPHTNTWSLTVKLLTLLAVVLAIAVASVHGDGDYFEHMDEDKNGVWSEEEFEEFLEKLHLEKQGSAGHSDGHDGHNHRRSFNLRMLDSDECHPAEEIFEEFDTDNSTTLTETEMNAGIPFLMLLAAEGVCATTAAAAAHKDCHVDDAEAWLGGLLATIVISLTGAVGVVLFPFVQKRWVLSAVVSLAVGVLVGDSFFHLIPHGLNIHVHEDKEPLYKLMMGVIAIVVFFVMEKTIHHLGGHHHRHGHGGKAAAAAPSGKVLDDDMSGDEYTYAHVSSTPNESSSVPASSDEESADTIYSEEEEETSATASSTAYSEEQEQEGKMSVYDDEYGVSSELEERGTIFHTHRCFDMEAYAWNNLIGDGVHNLIDGLIIGVTFQASISAGISTAIAVFFHELPQEMGDAGILFKAGFGKKKAIFFNLLSSVFAIVGCIIGLLIGEEYAEAQPYFLLFTAGVFLYLALADLIPQLVDANTLNMALIQMAGIFIGLLIMYIIAITEEEEDCGLDSHSDH